MKLFSGLALALVAAGASAAQSNSPGTNTPVSEQEAEKAMAAGLVTNLPAKGIEAPIEFIHGLPVVSVKVNGAGPYKFGIETGAPYFVVSPRVVESQKERTENQTVPPPGEEGAHPVISLGSVTLGALRWEGVQAVEGRFADDSIDGVIGLPGFRDMLLTIDYPGKRLILSHDSLPAPNGRDILPLLPVGPFCGVEIQAGDSTFTAVVDTRSTGGFAFSPSDAEHLKFDGPLQVVGHARGAAFAPVEVKAGRLATDIHLGAYSFKQPFAEVRPLPAPLPQEPLVGTRVLQFFVVSIDQRSRAVRFARADTSPIVLPAQQIPPIIVPRTAPSAPPNSPPETPRAQR